MVLGVLMENLILENLILAIAAFRQPDEGWCATLIA
jgi:hypothetical protein